MGHAAFDAVVRQRMSTPQSRIPTRYRPGHTAEVLLSLKAALPDEWRLEVVNSNHDATQADGAHGPYRAQCDVISYESNRRLRENDQATCDRGVFTHPIDAREGVSKRAGSWHIVSHALSNAPHERRRCSGRVDVVHISCVRSMRLLDARRLLLRTHPYNLTTTRVGNIFAYE